MSGQGSLSVVFSCFSNTQYPWLKSKLLIIVILLDLVDVTYCVVVSCFVLGAVVVRKQVDVIIYCVGVSHYVGGFVSFVSCG